MDPPCRSVPGGVSRPFPKPRIGVLHPAFASVVDQRARRMAGLQQARAPYDGPARRRGVDRIVGHPQVRRIEPASRGGRYAARGDAGVAQKLDAGRTGGLRLEPLSRKFTADRAAAGGRQLGRSAVIAPSRRDEEEAVASSPIRSGWRPGRLRRSTASGACPVPIRVLRNATRRWRRCPACRRF